MNEVEKRAEKNFIEYAGAVIKARAISNIEDNLKPVHKRVLWTYYNRKVFDDAKTQKCATLAGAVLAYHPHGDVSVYDTMVRLAQLWKMRYPLIEFQGNVGNILGDSAASSRYTESRLSKIGMLMLEDIDKNCVPMIDNYDNTLKEPELLPSKFPNILCNGSLGIAVGISASLVPFNYNEVADGIEAYIKNNNLTEEELIKLIPGPDFPVGGLITNAEELLNIYKTGRGTINCRAHYHIEKNNGRDDIVFTDLPYLVEVESGVIVPLKKLVNEENCDFFYDFQNNTNEKKVEIHIILEKGTPIESALYLLFSKTKLEQTIKINNNVLVDGEPQTVGILGLIKGYVKHRNNVIVAIAKNEVEKLNHKLTITLGLIKCTSDIDNVVKIIRNADNRDAAKRELMEKYQLTEEQVNAVLDMKLSRLSRLDIKDLQDTAKQLESDLVKQNAIVNDVNVRNDIIIKQLEEMRKIAGDKRRTEIQYTKDNSAVIKTDREFYCYAENVNDLVPPTSACLQVLTSNDINNLICYSTDGSICAASNSNNNKGFFVNNNKEFLITVSKQGYIKKCNFNDAYKGRKGKIAKLKDNDELFYCSTANGSDYILLINKQGDFAAKIAVSEFKEGAKLSLVLLSGLSELRAALIGDNEDNIIMIDSENHGKITMFKDFNDNSRTSKGQKLNNIINFLLPYRKNIYIVTGNGKISSVVT